MLVFEDFQETSSIQTTLFTPSYVFSTSEVLKRVIQIEQDMFDGGPIVLPLPDDAPHEIPRITLENQDKTLKLEVAPARVDFFRSKSKEEDKIIPNDFVGMAAPFLTKLLETIGAKCGRMAAVINRSCRRDNPGEEIALHFCKENFLGAPFDPPSAFELHSLKKYEFMESLQVNSWVRIRSGVVQPENSVSHPVVIAHQDINTLAELMGARIFTSEEISAFYGKVCEEFDNILKLYFPK